MKTHPPLPAGRSAPQRVRLRQPLAGVVTDRVATIARGLRNALHQWCRAQPDPRTAYLSQATDHADLERRMRDWDGHPLGRRP